MTMEIAQQDKGTTQISPENKNKIEYHNNSRYQIGFNNNGFIAEII